MYKLKIGQWGTGLAVRIPAEMRDELKKKDETEMNRVWMKIGYNGDTPQIQIYFTEMKGDVYESAFAMWGTSLALRLPARIAKVLELRAGDEIGFEPYWYWIFHLKFLWMWANENGKFVGSDGISANTLEELETTRNDISLIGENIHPEKKWL